MKVAIIGGTGFVGHYIIDELLAANHQPIVLCRAGSENKVPHHDNVQLLKGDIDDPKAIAELMNEAEAVIYLIGILRENHKQNITFEKLQYQGAKLIIDAAIKAKVSRFLLMSANGIKEYGTAYQHTKYLAEQYLKASNLNWTIFRPSVLFGDPHGRMEFATQLRHELIDMPLPIPLFFDGFNVAGAGKFEMSPTHVKDVAQAFVTSIAKQDCYKKTYHLCGPDNISWKEILGTIAGTVGKKKLMLPAPTWGIKSVAFFLDRFQFFPISRDQVTMLLEGNTCNGTEGFSALGISPKAFNRESLDYLNH